ncbi:hypothetical protein H5410_011436 [Solanum commersonii]|uniref:Uncharacterized protein n=1 Tax=Solanum commersonii TaxID=4109 RepID=A0A9J6APX2_SOLCO|nr:hypothetical protein H5410_011436 [Solanum commersonii]
MINDAFGMHSDFEQGENVEEASNEEANIFYEQLRDFSSPLFNGSQHSKLSIAVRLLSIKSDNNNISQGAMDSMIELMKELVDPNGYSHLGRGSNIPSSSASQCNSLNASSGSIRLSNLHIESNGSEPNTPTTQRLSDAHAHRP